MSFLCYNCPNKNMSKIKLWYLYDFANSFASSVIVFFFPLLLSEKGASDTWIGISVVISTIILLSFYPKLGNSADISKSKRILYIKISSFVMSLSLLLLAFISNTNEVFSFTTLAILSVLYIIFQISFQGSYVFYSAMMQDFENEGSDKNKVSSFGLGIGQLGNAISIGLMGALIIGSGVTLFGLFDKSLAIFLGAFIFLFLAYPFLFSSSFNYKGGLINKNLEFFSYKKFLLKIKENKKVLYFLIGYMLVADSISTLQVYLSLYMKNVFGFTDKMTSIGGAISLLALFSTCMFLGRYVNKFENKNKLLLIGGVVYVFAFLCFALSPTNIYFVFTTLIFAGIAYGLFFPLARSIYSSIIPKDSQAMYFSAFIIFERAATIFGPIIWIVIFFLLSSFGVQVQYRGNLIFLAMVAMVGLTLIRKSFKIKN